MKTMTICSEWIKEVRDGHSIPWNYDYKEYVFNDEYTEAFSIRLPQKANGIKAILLSNDSGIKEEYSRVYLDNGTIVKIFDIDRRDEIIADLESKNEFLEAEVKALKAKLEAIRKIV